MLMADVQHDYARTRIGLLDHMDVGTVEQDLKAMKADGLAALKSEGFVESQCRFNTFVDLRYVGQEHSVTMPISFELGAQEIERLTREFSEAHERAYGHVMPDPIELVAVRLSAVGVVDPPDLQPSTEVSTNSVEPVSTRAVVTDAGNASDYKVYHRDELKFGHKISGPLIVTEHTSTTVTHEGDNVEVGPYGELVITIGGVN
jgi:N-methylhydantoinase A